MGGYCIDFNNSSNNSVLLSSTLRFYIQVDGTAESSTAAYGDVSIPKGWLYFALPCYIGSGSGGGVGQLSSKERIVTIRQIGWNSGWRREENRILGVFCALPINEARKHDKF